MQKPRSKFKAWVIQEFGSVEHFATHMGYGKSAAFAWLSRKYTPRLETALEIVKHSRGVLTCKDILEGTRPQ